MLNHTPRFPQNLIFLLIIWGTLQSCSEEQKPKRSVCIWKTSFDFNREDDTLFSQLGIEHVYLRFFDVDWNPYLKEALPQATLNNLYLYNQDSLEFTPCIFITNKVMLYSSRPQLDSLAINIGKRVNSLIKELGLINYRYDFKNYNYGSKGPVMDSIESACEEKFRRQVRELLIDCDWSEKSKENYFYFLEKMQEGSDGLIISATIRLWQYKYRENAGIPPVDRGLLMCYNLQSAEDYNIENSISSAAELEKYIVGKKYPVDLDIAFPVFSWAVLFRGGKFLGIISEITAEECKNDSLQYAQIGENRFVFKTDKVQGDIYIRSGDELRIEKVSAEELDKISHLLKEKKIANSQSRITFFSYEKKYINDYGIKNIDKIYSLFNN